jgi:hypothetical protein
MSGKRCVLGRKEEYSIIIAVMCTYIMQQMKKYNSVGAISVCKVLGLIWIELHNLSLINSTQVTLSEWTNPLLSPTRTMGSDGLKVMWFRRAFFLGTTACTFVQCWEIL